MKYLKKIKFAVSIILLFLVVGLNKSFGQNGAIVGLINSSKEKIVSNPKTWKERLISLSEEIPSEHSEVKLIVMNVLLKANKANKSSSSCVQNNFLGQVYIELTELAEWLLDSSKPLTFNPVICPLVDEYKYSEIGKLKELKIEGFNIPDDLKVIFYDDLAQKNYNLKKWVDRVDENVYVVKIQNFNVLKKMRTLGDRQLGNSDSPYTLVFKSASKNYVKRIRFNPKTYNEEARFYEQQELRRKSRWECDKVYPEEINPVTQRTKKIFLLNQQKGDGDFGGDVTYEMKYRFKLSKDRKQIFLDRFSFKAIECCECHTLGVLCGNEQNKSVWTSQSDGDRLIYEAPEHYEFIPETINQEEISESYLIKKDEEEGLFERKRFPDIPFVKVLYLKASTGGYDATLRGLFAMLEFPNKQKFVMKRIGECVD